jgi:hypothetical protein
MNARWRIFVAASAALLAAGTPAFAQEAPAPAQDALIGNPQLRNFSINGTVTVPAPVPEEESRQSPPRAAAARNEQAPTSRPTQPARESAQSASRPEPPAREDNDRRAASSAIADSQPPAQARRVALPTVVAAGEPTANPQPSFAPASQATLDVSQGGVPMLPWLIAAFALAGAAAWYFLRQRPRASYAGAGRLNVFDAPSVPPPPVRAPPRAPARPAPPAKPPSTGIVSTRLRPWLEIEFKPVRAVVDEEKAAVRFELSVFNSGSVPARDVLLEASLFNAGPQQDQQIRLFFDNPVAKGDRIPLIPPLQRVAVSTAVFLPRDQVRPIEIEGRQLFVPLIAFNALYSWGNDNGQSSASYLIGKQTKGEKLAPFRLDLGPRMFRNLAAREHQLRLRK